MKCRAGFRFFRKGVHMYKGVGDSVTLLTLSHFS